MDLVDAQAELSPDGPAAQKEFAKKLQDLIFVGDPSIDRAIQLLSTPRGTAKGGDRLQDLQIGDSMPKDALQNLDKNYRKVNKSQLHKFAMRLKELSK
jgi:hypothetical protein